MLSRPCVSEEERLGPLAGPLYRAAELAGGVAGQHVLGIQEQLHAEAASHIRRHDAELLLRHLEHCLAEQRLDDPTTLRVGVQRPAAIAVVGQGGARLHAVDDDAVVHDRQPGDVGGAQEQLLHPLLVARFPVEAGVVPRAGPNGGLTLVGRQGEVGDRGQYVILDADRLGTVAGGLRRLGDHEGDRVPHMADGLARQHGVRRVEAGGAVPVLQRNGAGQAADAVRLEVPPPCRRRRRRRPPVLPPCRWRQAWPRHGASAIRRRTACPGARCRPCSGRSP